MVAVNETPLDTNLHRMLALIFILNKFVIVSEITICFNVNNFILSSLKGIYYVCVR